MIAILARGRRAAATVAAAGGDAMAQAKAAIDATFDGANAHNLLKGRVDWMIRRGADDFDVRMRYGRRAQMLLALPLEAAMSRVRVLVSRRAQGPFRSPARFGRGHAAALIPAAIDPPVAAAPAPQAPACRMAGAGPMPWRRRASI